MNIAQYMQTQQDESREDYLLYVSAYIIRHYCIPAFDASLRMTM